MDATQINQTFDLIALVSGDTKLSRAGTYYCGPCPFCGGRDRFVIKQTQSGQRWYCRHCGDEKYHTPIDYVMRREKLDFKAALKRMGGNGEKNLRRQKKQVTIKKKPPVLPDQAWQSAAWKEVDTASDRLLSGNEQIGSNYLLERGIHRGTWNAWHLGIEQIYDPKIKSKRPAIVIPWLDLDASQNTLTAIKYRFIDNNPDGLRYISRRGSAPILFGLWSALSEHHTLLLIEGEINALSVWQCIPVGVSCISIGSDTGNHPEMLKALASDYQNVFIWMDDANKAGKMRSLLGISAKALQSPVIDGEKWDANKMLQRGLLMDFLSQRIDTDCFGWALPGKPNNCE